MLKGSVGTETSVSTCMTRTTLHSIRRVSSILTVHGMEMMSVAFVWKGYLPMGSNLVFWTAVITLSV